MQCHYRAENAGSSSRLMDLDKGGFFLVNEADGGGPGRLVSTPFAHAPGRSQVPRSPTFSFCMSLQPAGCATRRRSDAMYDASAEQGVISPRRGEIVNETNPGGETPPCCQWHNWACSGTWKMLFPLGAIAFVIGRNPARMHDLAERPDAHGWGRARGERVSGK